MNEWLSQGRSVIGVFGHYGNWEYITAYQLHCPRVHVMQLYKRLTNEFSENLMLHIRQRFGSECVEAGNAYRRLLAAKRSGEQVAVGFIADQAVWPAHFWLEFMHQDSPVFEGAQRISSKLDFGLVYFDIYKVKRGYYEVKVIPMAEHPAEFPEHALTERYFRLLENTIRRNPEYYLWSHNRWKFKRS
ncbi:MAG: lysophospholipid acyltransferase family protein, partial [Paludibacteraceae bacterium]|nr:lysophospholipid acyltransferase family protein [Paludibacteraceae bacterium]